jgi:hypothetical protein
VLEEYSKCLELQALMTIERSMVDRKHLLLTNSFVIHIDSPHRPEDEAIGSKSLQITDGGPNLLCDSVCLLLCSSWTEQKHVVDQGEYSFIGDIKSNKLIRC